MTYTNPAPLIIGIDTGNRCIKTANHVFVAGVEEVQTGNSMFTESLTYNGRRYALTTHRVNYATDKTDSEGYFVLSLFAILRELKTRGIDATSIRVPLVLAVGLPPRDVARLQDRFAAYFKRGQVDFSNRNTNYQIYIQDVKVFPQGFSAIVPDFPRIKSYRKCFIVDVGGYTTDVIELNGGRLDPKMCRSLDAGMIHLFNDAAQAIQSGTGQIVSEDQIDQMLETNRELNSSTNLLPYVTAEAQNRVNSIVSKLFELGIDLSTNKAIFVGGGAARLAPFIQACGRIVDPEFIPDPKANAKGYEALYAAILRRENGQQ